MSLVKELLNKGFWKFKHSTDPSSDSYHFESKQWPFEFYYVAGIPKDADDKGTLEVSLAIYRQ